MKRVPKVQWVSRWRWNGYRGRESISERIIAQLTKQVTKKVTEEITERVTEEAVKQVTETNKEMIRLLCAGKTEKEVAEALELDIGKVIEIAELLKDR